MVRSSRRSNVSKGLLSRVYSPVHHTISAARDIVNTGLSSIDSMGMSLTGHANAAVKNVFTRRGRRAERKSRRAERKSRRAERKSRRSTRKSRRSTRK
jgi:hypothetical protein